MGSALTVQRKVAGRQGAPVEMRGWNGKERKAGQAQGAFKGTSSLGPYLSDQTRGEFHWASAGGLLWLRLSHWSLVSALGDLDRFSVSSILEVGERRRRLWSSEEVTSLRRGLADCAAERVA